MAGETSTVLPNSNQKDGRTTAKLAEKLTEQLTEQLTKKVRESTDKQKLCVTCSSCYSIKLLFLGFPLGYL